MTGEISTSYETKRRILQVNTVEMSGGAASIAWNLHRAYGKRGLRSWMAVGQKQTKDPNVFEIPNEQAGGLWTRSLLRVSRRLRLLGAPRPSQMLTWMARPIGLWDIYRGIEDFRYPGSWRLLELPPENPDIVHCHNLHGGYFDLGVLSWLSHQVPVVLTLHDAWLLSGHCAHSFDCERWRTGCGQCPDLAIYPAVRRDGTAYNWQRKRDIFTRSRLYVATPSRWLMEKAKQSMLIQAIETTRVIPHGVDLGVFRPGDPKEARKALSLPESATIILLIAHNPFKDYNTMEAALSRLGKKNDAELVFVCLGKTDADKSVGQGRMIYRGFERSQERMVFYYRACDIYIHAAKDEAFGLTVTEALACGVPTVATAIGGIKEQVEDGMNGFLVPSKDFEAMANRVRQLMVDKELYRRVAIKAAESARQRFDLNRQVEDYLDWYDEILAAHRSEHSADI